MNGMIGKTISHYLVLEKLGEGGMGVVYKGEDTKLKRTVALKFLTPQIIGSEEDKTRFVHEAQTSAALDHPNICTTYEIDEAEGQPFIAMGYVEGRSLKQKIEAGPLKLDEALDIVIQAAEGLQAAHEKEIVHRDIKSANIMVTAKGHVKVMDFGLAKLPGRTKLTRVGGVMGTVAYMSPEQARGEQVDQRTDIWSLGIVLYESVTGRPPFYSDYEQAMVYSILNEDPKPITGLVPDLPVELEHVVNKALAKSAADRYQHADEMLVDLRTLREEIGSGTARTSKRLEYSWQKKGTLVKARRPIPRLSGKVAALLAVTVLLILLLFLFPSTRENLAEWLGIVQVPEQKYLAVLPFINVGGDPNNQSYCDGLVETLNSKLTQLEQFHGSLWVVPTSDVRAREITSASKAQQSFGVNLVVTGSVQRMNGRFRLTMNLVDAKTLRQLSSSVIDYGLTNISVLQDETVIRVASMLDVQLNPQARRVLRAGFTTVPGAYEFYLQGLGYIQGYEKEENLNTAIGLFKRAIGRDSLYALAYAGLGEAYWRRYEVSKDAHWVEPAVKNCERAVDLNDLLAPVNVTLGLIHTGTGRYDEAIQQFQRALALDPVSAAAYGGLARAYESMGRLKEAESTYKRAIELKPDYWAGYNELGVFYTRYGRYQEAVTQFRYVVDLTPQNVRGYTNLGGLYFYLNRWKDAIEIFERSLDIEPNYRAYSNLATISYYEQRYSDAARMYEKALGFDDRNYVVWGNLASAYYWTPDERPKAKEVYQRAISLAREQLKVNPNDTEVLSQLAGYYAMIGDRANVRSILQQLTDLKPDDLQVLSHIGTTYETLGERELALQWIEKALEGGYSQAEIENEPGLKELRADTRFELLLQRIGDKNRAEKH